MPDLHSCERISRSFEGQDGTTQKRMQYECAVTATNGAPAKLRITSLQVDEIGIAALLNDAIPSRWHKRLGRISEVVQSETLREISYLNRQFSETPEQDEFVEISSELDGVGLEDEDLTETERRELNRLLRLPAINQGVHNINYEFALPDAIRAVSETQVWPSEFEHFYVVDRTDPDKDRRRAELHFRKRKAIAATHLWRNLTVQEIRNFAGALSRAEEDGFDDFELKPAKRYASLLRYITRGYLPQDFLFVLGGVEHDSFEFRVHPRHVFLQLILIQNTSDTPVELVQLGFDRERDVNLRPIATTSMIDARTVSPNSHASWTIPPKETLAVPAAILLGYSQNTVKLIEDAKSSVDGYGLIQAYPPGQLFEYIDRRNWTDYLTTPPLMVKERKGFKPAKIPALQPYVFGPRLRLNYIETATSRVFVEEPDTLLLAVNATYGGAAAQCPYLYSWDPDRNSLVSHGKVLIGARNRGLARGEAVTFEGLRLKFRLAEHELETAYLDAAKLQLSLKDGSNLSLVSKDPRLQKSDGDEAVADLGQHIDITFRLPDGVMAGDVEQSTLTIYGYYRRYGAQVLADGKSTKSVFKRTAVHHNRKLLTP
ncbi:MAG: hypothetical protein RIC14_03445 [Filomicrobium sp.]